MPYGGNRIKNVYQVSGIFRGGGNRVKWKEKPIQKNRSTLSDFFMQLSCIFESKFMQFSCSYTIDF